MKLSELIGLLALRLEEFGDFDVEVPNEEGTFSPVMGAIAFDEEQTLILCDEETLDIFDEVQI